MSKNKQSHAYFIEFGANLRKLREKRGWSLEQTEDHGFHDWKYMQKIESGRNITLDTLIRVADLYDLEPWELLKGVKVKK